MDRFIDSIEASLESKNWMAALFLALAMPDICRSLERPKIGRGETGFWYKDWVNRYIADKYNSSRFEECNFYADDFWLYRCSCLHAGMDADSKGRMMKFCFTPPDDMGNSVHLNYIGDRLQLQIDIFCQDMITAVKDWLAETENNPDIKERMTDLIQITPTILNPFIIIK